MASFTNQRAYQSLRGQAVLVQVATDQLDDLQLISEGMIATNQSSGKTGRVGHVDYFGTTFQVIPKQPNLDFASASTYGYIAANETVTVV
jgi:hypothetical protein